MPLQLTDTGLSVVIYSDGGARGNPGPAGIGFVIHDTAGNELAADGEYIGEATNNFAEYTALIAALQRALQLGASEVQAHADSELMVKQLNGEYRVKHPDLQPLYGEVRSLAARFKRFGIVHVRRERNKAADRLVNAAVDAHFAGGAGKATQE